MVNKYFIFLIPFVLYNCSSIDQSKGIEIVQNEKPICSKGKQIRNAKFTLAYKKVSISSSDINYVSSLNNIAETEAINIVENMIIGMSVVDVHYFENKLLTAYPDKLNKDVVFQYSDKYPNIMFACKGMSCTKAIEPKTGITMEVDKIYPNGYAVDYMGLNEGRENFTGLPEIDFLIRNDLVLTRHKLRLKKGPPTKASIDKAYIEGIFNDGMKNNLKVQNSEDWVYVDNELDLNPLCKSFPEEIF